MEVEKSCNPSQGMATVPVLSCTNTALNKQPVPDWKSSDGWHSPAAGHVPEDLEIQGNSGTQRHNVPAC